MVERLPARPGLAERRARAELQRDPSRLPLALAVAREAIDRARREGDPREYGAALHVLEDDHGLHGSIRRIKHLFEYFLIAIDLPPEFEA